MVAYFCHDIARRYHDTFNNFDISKFPEKIILIV